MDLVTCLLDFRLNFASNRSIVPRLAASLAACAQLSALGEFRFLLSLISDTEKLFLKPVCIFCISCSCWPQNVGFTETTKVTDY